MSLDLAFVRAQFPALSDGFAYFDNAGGSLVLKRVAERISDYLLTTSVQTGAAYAHSQRASARLAEARAACARLVNARRPEEVFFASSTTVAMRALSEAMASQFQPGDEVVLTVFDHESNIGPWLTLKDRGVVFKFWSVDPATMTPSLDDLEALVTAKTKLVCVTHCSNILGAIMPIAEIAALVHAHGAKLCVDGVAFAPHRAVDVRALDCDYYVFSFYKTFGPHFAMAYGKYDALAELDGLYHYFYDRSKTPAKLEPGNPSYELAWGAAGVVEYLDELGGGGRDHAAIVRAFDAVAAHEEAIAERLLAYLRARNDVAIVGPATADRAARAPTISFKPARLASSDVVAAIDRAQIGVRYGDFHSRRLVEHLGLADGDGVVRVSMAHYNTLDEVDALVERLDETLGNH